jgi:hypothetical protein
LSAVLVRSLAQRYGPVSRQAKERRGSLMPTVAIRIDMPPRGVLEETGDGSAPTDEQMKEEQEVRKEFLDRVGPLLASLPGRPPKRQGNVSQVELHGTDVWSELNHYLLLVTVDIGDPGIDLTSVLPDGAEVSVVGSYTPLASWPEGGSAAPTDGA